MAATQESFIVKRQESLQRHYVEMPGDAWITDHAHALVGNSNTPVHGEVELANSEGVRQQYGIHRAVGGDHDAPNPGDFLSAALAACLHSTLRMVAERLQVVILDSEVTCTANVDVRGTLMVDTTVSVGFQRMHCDVRLKVPAGANERSLKTLMLVAENCCVVFQTLKAGTKVTTDWQIDQVS